MTKHRARSLLLCEDEEFLARSYARRFELEGYTVIHAYTGDEALAHILSDHPDIVLLDLMMPHKSGFEVLEAISREDDALIRNIPIIVLSNLSQRSDIDEAKRLGADEYVVKSNASLKEIVDMVKHHTPGTLDE